MTIVNFGRDGKEILVKTMSMTIYIALLENGKKVLTDEYKL